MFFYCFELDNKSKDMCTINTLFGLYCYVILPIGVKKLPDTAQTIINKILVFEEMVYIKSYDVPYWKKELFSQELQRLCKEGVLEKCNEPSGWVAPTFITPKKDN